MIDREDIKYLGLSIRNLLNAYSSREEFISGLDNLLVSRHMETQIDCINIISAPTLARKSHRYLAASQLAYLGKLYKKDGSWAFRKRDPFVKGYQTRGMQSRTIVCKPYRMIKKVLEEFAPPGTNLQNLLAGYTPREIRRAFAFHGLADDRLRLASPLIELPYGQYELLRKLWNGERE